MLELNKIYLGDNRDLIKQIESNSIDLIWFSPPYWNIHKYSNNSKEIGYNQSLEKYIDSLLFIINESSRILKDTGNLVINIMDLVRNNEPILLSDKLIYGTREKNINLKLVEKIIWRIRNKMPVASQRRLVNKFEWLIHWSKTDNYFCDIDIIREPHSHYALKDKRKWKWNSKGKNPGNIWDISCYHVSGKNKLHQAAFPIELCDKVIKYLCPENGIVLDPFVGCGTSCLSAKKLNRNYIGFELSEDYYNTAIERLLEKDKNIDFFHKQEK